jgi:hypothetical protein
VRKLLLSRMLSKYVKIKALRYITLPVVSYGCENWSIMLSEGRMLRMFGNRVLKECLVLRGSR